MEKDCGLKKVDFLFEGRDRGYRHARNLTDYVNPTVNFFDVYKFSNFLDLEWWKKCSMPGS